MKSYAETLLALLVVTGLLFAATITAGVVSRVVYDVFTWSWGLIA